MMATRTRPGRRYKNFAKDYPFGWVLFGFCDCILSLGLLDSRGAADDDLDMGVGGRT
jgi:hypothetical protein